MHSQSLYFHTNLFKTPLYVATGSVYAVWLFMFSSSFRLRSAQRWSMRSRLVKCETPPQTDVQSLRFKLQNKKTKNKSPKT